MARSESPESSRKGVWVTVGTYDNASMAHLARMRLEDAGIPCFVEDEHTGASLWHLLPAIGGIKLRVPAPFEQQAREALESRGDSTHEHGSAGDEEVAELDRDEEDEFDEDPDETDEDEPYSEESEASGQACPSCHSTDVAHFSWVRRIGQAGLVLFMGVGLGILHIVLLAACVFVAIYLILVKPDYRCLRCGKRWIASAERN